MYSEALVLNSRREFFKNKMNFNGLCETGIYMIQERPPEPHQPYPKHVLSIEIKATDNIIILPNVETTDYDFIQYNKTIETPNDVIFFYNQKQIGKIYHHRYQTIIFQKFISANSHTWII
jgi:hypothetical protein